LPVGALVQARKHQDYTILPCVNHLLPYYRPSVMNAFLELVQSKRDPTFPSDLMLLDIREIKLHLLQTLLYKLILSFQKECVLFNVNLDVTSYFNGKKENHNIPGRAYPVVVWDFYKNGCSLRMLNPQAFSLNLWKVMSILQEFFGSMVGANIYLTPPGTQGFAPHYDDIEAFVLQLEGSKYWRIYNPRTEGEFLPQVSSVNLTEEDLGKPVLEVVLEPGDLLYFPRGFIHQASCLPTTHSLHVTISTYQKHTWGNLLKKILPAALEGALQDDVEFRQGLPLNYLEYTGVQHCEKVNAQRKKFIKKINSLIGRLQAYAGIDAAVDQKAKEFMHDCLPPVLSKDEIACSVHGAPTRWENGKPRDVLLDMKGDTEIRMLHVYSPHRLFSEDNRILLSYTVENSRIYHEVEPQSIEIDPELADGMEYLLCAYPEFKTIRSIPCADLEEKVCKFSGIWFCGCHSHTDGSIKESFFMYEPCKFLS
uniref:Bifunctional lysine-specific demethylase and histidyl-hydroxylase n=1 Tax=Callorhinchus milii TaxID=7868 RepID=A0A4W3JV16_CALMI